MVHLYVSELVTRLSVRGNRVVTWCEESGEADYPIETIDGITLFGRPSMTTPFILEMLKRKLSIQLFSMDGHYQGRISAPDEGYAPRLRAQVHRSEDPAFCLALSKLIVSAKVNAQLALVAAHGAAAEALDAPVRAMRHSAEWVRKAASIPEVSGFEGNAAKAYFAALRTIVAPEFAFNGRSTRPPKDAFNSMISLGYSLLYKNVVGAIERHSLNSYLGFLHQDSRGHATLASDLMEVWRAPIVDDTVLRLIAEGAVNADAFTTNPDTGGVYANWDVTRSLARAFGNRIARTATYIAGDSHRYTFQYALDLQLQSLVRAIETGDPHRFAEIQATSEYGA